MKKLLLFTLLVISNFISSQDLPSIPASGFSFSLGTKITIKLVPTDSLVYDYSIIGFEPFQEIINSRNSDYLFEDKGEEDTIVFYFCVGTYGETDEEKEKNAKIHLVFKNYSKKAFEYISEIQREENGEYETTSNVGTYPGVKTNEIWPYMIYNIGIRDFREYKLNRDNAPKPLGSNQN